MRQRNHCSSLKGIPKMKLQGSGPSTPKSLQSQNRPRPENRLSISRLGVVHGQRCMRLVEARLGDSNEGAFWAAAPLSHAIWILWFFSGNERMRWPVALKNALSTAGAATQIVGSPTPPQGSLPPDGKRIDSTLGIS